MDSMVDKSDVRAVNYLKRGKERPDGEVRKANMCRKCGVPSKGHACPFRKKRKSADEIAAKGDAPKKKKKGKTIDTDLVDSSKRKRTTPPHEKSHFEIASPTQNANNELPRDTAVTRPICGKPRICRKCRVPMRGHKCPYRVDKRASVESVYCTEIDRNEKENSSSDPEHTPSREGKVLLTAQSEDSITHKHPSYALPSDPRRNHGNGSPRDRLCRKCRVPMKGHKCPHKKKAELPATASRAPARHVHRDLEPEDSSTSQHSGLMLLRGAAISVLEERQSEAERGRRCRKCNVPFKGHKCPYRATKAKKIHDTVRSDERVRFRDDVALDLHVETKATIPTGQESQDGQDRSRRAYTCTMCGVPLKGHICPYSETQRRSGKMPLVGNDRGQNAVDNGLDTLSAVAAFASGNEEEPKPNLTEVMAPAHLLHDEIHSYLLKQNLTDLERYHLQTWAGNVQTHMLDKNRLILENIELSGVRKTVAKSVSEERDALVTLRAKIRRIQSGNEQLGGRIATQRQENSANAAASRFLGAIDSLRGT